MQLRFRFHALARSLCVAAWIGIAFAACGPPDQHAEEHEDAGPPKCADSSSCDGELCVGGACTKCATDDHCALDSVYGVGATCDTATGACAPCAKGTKDCACNANKTCAADLICSDAAKCVACPSGTKGCLCKSDGSCEGELACAGGTCAEPACVPGTATCPCKDGGCTGDALCVSNTCVACAADRVGCACDAGACTQNLVCDATSGNCRATKQCADVGCADHQTCSAANGGADAECEKSCDTGYDWDDAAGACDALVGASCASGSGGGIGDNCTARHRACTVDSSGASCGACVPGYVTDDAHPSFCRAQVTCKTLHATCDGEERRCANASGADATCGACEPGFFESGGTCGIDENANCIPNDPKGLVDACAALERTCLPGATVGAGCGACLPGFVDDPAFASACVDGSQCTNTQCTGLRRVCAPGSTSAPCGGCQKGFVPSDATNPASACIVSTKCADITCPTGKACFETDGVGACIDWPCASALSAQRKDSGACVTCGNVCGDGQGGPANGETGKLFPYTRDGRDVCMCETEPGFYLDVTAALAARPCDEDGDGWLRGGVRDVYASGDTQLIANARCAPRTVDRVVLQNEWGQQREILICKTGRVAADQGTCDASGYGAAMPLVLYETERNDDPSLVNAASETDFPAFANVVGGTAARGRRLHADEVTPLTKACVSDTADFNGNGAADLNEWHGMPTPNRTPALSEDERVWLDFAYFVELERSWYVPPASGATYGKLVIADRSRCDTSSGTAWPFPLGYTETNSYWRTCTRRRDAAYDLTTAGQPFGLTTLDFARWDCADGAGSCPVLPPVTTGTPAAGAVAKHGVCDAKNAPADGKWRGMGHESQFKCVQLLANATQKVGRQDLLRTDLFSGGTSTALREWNTCAIDCPASDPTCASDCQSGGACSTETVSTELQPKSPHVTCAPTLATTTVPADRAVGFTSIRFQTGPAYLNGCVDEEYEFPQLCPGWTPPSTDPTVPPTQSGTLVGSDQSAFGQLACGCSANNGGVLCEIACPPDLVNRTTPYQTIGRNGMFWMCGGIAGSAGVTTPMQGATFSIRDAQVPISTQARTPLCSATSAATTGPAGTPPCTTGWRLY